jgi:hypothetical protein
VLETHTVLADELELTSDRGEVSLENQSKADATRYVRDARQKPRFPLEVGIQIYPRNSAVVHGYTIDLSESGLAAMLRDEVPLGELVRLEFTLPLGKVEILALVRQRNAFRFGFQFVEAASADDTIGLTCRQLALTNPAPPPAKP